MSDHDFCRLLLSETRKELTVEQRKKLVGSWSYMYRMFGAATDGEFHVRTDGFYWYGSACCAYEARSQGINAWLEKNYPEQASNNINVALRDIGMEL